MRNYKMIIAYDGGPFCGWQVQPNGVTIQEVLEEKMAILLKVPPQVVGSGRTDAGVHAMGQVAHFHFDGEIESRSFLRSLNALLPDEIRVRHLEEVTGDFHARYSATGKEYHYHVALQPDPVRRKYSYHPRAQLDIEKMRLGAAYFLGEHDFSSFANERGAPFDPVRTITRLDLIEEGEMLRVEMEGNGFLYKMVRNMVGALLDCGKGKTQPVEIGEMLQAKDRTVGPAPAPAEGLFLVRVMYEDAC